MFNPCLIGVPAGFLYEASSVRVRRIELRFYPWQGYVLPLNYTRSMYTSFVFFLTLMLLHYSLFPLFFSTFALCESVVSPALLLHMKLKNAYKTSLCAPARTRTRNNGSEDRCDVHFTTGAWMMLV
jgi:cytochrome c biogenesis protein CcdA